MQVYSSCDIVGDVAIIRLEPASEKHGQKVAEALMNLHQNVKAVLAQTGAVSRARYQVVLDIKINFDPAGNDDASMKEFYSFATEVHRRNSSREKEADGDIGMPD